MRRCVVPRFLYVIGTLVAAFGMASMAPAETPRIIGHRGASFDAPENTLAAFDLAWKLSADGVEGDFYFTADKQIVCIHDADTKRTTGVQSLVESSSLEKLRQLDAGTWKDAKFAGERLPTFAEVIASIPSGKQFVIELKSREKIVPLLVDELARANRDDISLLIISFDEETVRQCKQQLPSVRAHWLTSFKRSKVTGKYAPTAVEVAQAVRRSGADGVGMNGNRECVDQAFIDTLHTGGCNEFHVWTVDDPQDAIFFRDLGAVGITTNRPDVIAKAIR